MEQRTKRDLALINLVNDFESKFEQGHIDFLDEKTLNQLIEYYEEESQLEKAIEVADIGLEQYQYRVDFYIIKARLLYLDNRITECLELIGQAELISPFERDIIILKVKALSCKKQFALAQSLLEDLRNISFSDDLIEVYVTESYIYESMKDHELMYTSLKNALTIDPNNAEALERFWYAVELAKKYDDSVAFHKELIDRNPYNHLAWFNLGMSFSCSWEYDKAIDAMEYAFIINDQFEAAYKECAELCIQQNKIDKAIDLYKDMNEKFGPDAEYMVSLASCLIKIKDIATAKSYLLKALKFDPYNEEVYFLLGECYTHNQNWYSAINAYLKAIELDSNMEDYYLALAKSYTQVEEYNKATINFHRATQVCQEESKYWCEYVRFILKLGLYKEALQILDEAEDSTFGVDLLYCRAITLFFLKKKKLGLEVLSEALEDDFNLHHIIYELAPELELDKDISAMVRYYQREFAE